MKTVVITGSSRGLGWELAKRFKKNGMNVVLNGVNCDRLEKARQELEVVPGDGRVFACFTKQNISELFRIARLVRICFLSGFFI